MDLKLLRKSVDALQRLRINLHDVVKPGVLADLDKIIVDLEQASDDEVRRMKQSDLLQKIGEFVRYIPAIAKVIEIIAKA